MRNAFIFTLLMILTAVAVSYSDIDKMNMGFALILLLGFLALIGLIVALVYIPRARAFDKLVREMKPLAHWTYSPAEWQAFLQEDLAEAKAISRSMWKLIVIIALVVGAGLWLWSGDPLYMLIVGGLIVFISIVAWLAPRIRNNAVRRGTQEVFINDSSVLVGGAFQTWTQLGARLAGAEIDTEKSIPILHIRFFYPTLQGPQEEIIRVPVPGGKMEEAEKVMAILQKQAQA